MIPPLEERFADTPWRRTRWLLSLRWVAAACVLGVVTAGRFLLRIPLPLPPLYLGVAFLVAANSLYTLWLRRLRGKADSAGLVRRVALFINLQIAVDLALLGYLLHFSGGIANPFVFFFVFHMVIAGILLSSSGAYLQAAWATVLFGLLLVGETSGFLPPYRGSLFPPTEPLMGRAAFPPGLLAAFASTEFITVYLTTSIANTLRDRDAELRTALSDLVAANRTLEAKDREKSLYVRQVSHDIKGSLSAIQSCLRVVLDGLVGAVEPKSEEMIGRAERRSVSLLRYVNELLFLSSLRAEDRRVTSELPVLEIARSVAEELGAAFRGKDIRLTVGGDPGCLRGDPELFAELVRQLLDNALRYTPRGGTVIVRVGILEEGQRGLRLSVADSGIGVLPADLPHVFEDFYAADIPENRDSTGAGLGLAIVRQITAMHGGNVEAESRPGMGSTFSCLFPAPE
jgi:signal transduction histidine kinase